MYMYIFFGIYIIQWPIPKKAQIFTIIMHAMGLSLTRAVPLAHEITTLARWP